MGNYEELIEELREEKLYPIYTILEGKAADAIEQLVKERDALKRKLEMIWEWRGVTE